MLILLLRRLADNYSIVVLDAGRVSALCHMLCVKDRGTPDTGRDTPIVCAQLLLIRQFLAFVSDIQNEKFGIQPAVNRKLKYSCKSPLNR